MPDRCTGPGLPYGSGGNAVGEELAHCLGYPCYNRQIIDLTALQMGYTSQYVEENEQNISTPRLWECIFTDSGIPASLNPSKEDALYVNQSRAIRGLAHNGSCIIIGRLGDWVLRDNPHVLRVFIMSGRDFAIKQIVQRFNLTGEQAAKKIEQVNIGRANYYWKYTGRQWTDVNNYDLVINTDRIGIHGAVDMIFTCCKRDGIEGNSICKYLNISEEASSILILKKPLRLLFAFYFSF